MKKKLTYIGLFFSTFNWPCNCYCRFCALGQKSYSNVSFDRVQGIVERFIAWRKDKGLPDFALNLMVGPSWGMDVKRLKKYWALCQHLDFNLGSRSILINGLALRPEDEFKDWLLERKEAGLTSVEFTFLGSRELQDKWRGRKGDYDFEMMAAKVASEIGLKRVERMFLTKSTIPHLTNLMDKLDPIPNLDYRWITLLAYGGWAKNMEDERITKDDFKKLPDRILRYVRTASALKTEGEWIESLRKGYEIPSVTFLNHHVRRQYETVLHLLISESNIDELESKSCNEIINGLKEKQDQLFASIPDLDELREKYGAHGNTCMYGLKELEHKWIIHFLKDNPHLIGETKLPDYMLGLNSVP